MVIERRDGQSQNNGDAGEKPATELNRIGKVVVAPAAKSSANSDDDDYDDDDDWRLEMSENAGVWVFE